VVATLEALRAENAAQRVQITALIEQVAQLSERISELLAVAQRTQRKSSPPASAAAPVALEGAAKRAFDERPAPPVLPEKPVKPPRQARPTGRKPLPQHLPAEEHALRPTHCEHCGDTALDAADEVIEEKLHVVTEHQRRRVVRRTTCRCRRCGGRTTPASLPAPYARSKVTCDWLAWFIHQKFGLLVPLDRVRRDLADRDIPLAMGSLVGFVERAADLLAPVDGVQWKQLLAGSWMATDGTGLKVLVPGLPAAHDGYIELYRDQSCAVFQYAATKAADEVVAKLAAFRGTLTADAEHRFNAVYATGRVVEAGCNAHGRRKFRDAEATQPLLAAEGGAFIAAMYVAEQDARDRGLVGDVLLAHRRARIRPVVDDFEKWLEAVEPTLLPSDLLRTAVAYYRNHWSALTRFIDDPEVPIDNSPTEREFQNVAKLRLNMLFAGSTEGAHRACVLLGIIATCRTVGVPVQAYLAWAFERLGTHRATYGLAADQLTPAAFKAAAG
jgi:transposase